MTTFILLGGQIHKASDGGKALCRELQKKFTRRPIRILDCLFARTRDAWEDRFETDKKFFLEHSSDFMLELAEPSNFLEQLKNSDVVVFQGGVPKQLLAVLEETGDWKQALVNTVVVASSGGADALCQYYGVGKTMNIREGAGILPIKIIPHWKAGSDYSNGVIVQWDQLADELRDYKETLPMYLLGEGEYVILEK